MRVRWTILALGLTAAVAVMAATAGARVAAPQSKTTTITFWHAFSADSPEVSTRRRGDPCSRRSTPASRSRPSRSPTTACTRSSSPRSPATAARPRPRGHHLGPRAREPRRPRAARHRHARLPDLRRPGLPGSARDQRVAGPLLRPAARHEHPRPALQRRRSRRRPASHAAGDVRRPARPRPRSRRRAPSRSPTTAPGLEHAAVDLECGRRDHRRGRAPRRPAT